MLRSDEMVPSSPEENLCVTFHLFSMSLLYNLPVDHRDGSPVTLRQAKFLLKFRMLLIGQANAGKKTILRRLCNTAGEPMITSKGLPELKMPGPGWLVSPAAG